MTIHRRSSKKIKVRQKIARRLDLHGMNLEQAYNESRTFLNQAKSENLKIVEIITGKSGKIAYEFPIWCETFGYKAQISLHGGSWTIRL